MNETLITAAISAVVAFLTVLATNAAKYAIEKMKYNHDYWKIAIEKRLNACELVEQLLIYFTNSSSINRLPLHMAFLNKEAIDDVFTKIAHISTQRSWLSTSTFTLILDLNRLLIEYNSEYPPHEFGIERYSELADLKEKIIISLHEDYLAMPDIKTFFQNKINEHQKYLKQGSSK